MTQYDMIGYDEKLWCGIYEELRIRLFLFARTHKESSANNIIRQKASHGI